MDLFMRKVISFGKNSHIITLPKEWVVKNKVSQGDVVSLKDNGDGLIVQAHLQPVKSPEKYLTINVDGKGLKKIKAEIFSAYLCNASTMEIIGNGLSTLAEEIKGIIHSLAGLEVLEQTSTKLVAKDLINVQEISLKATI
ncbi:AbrB/MazE/SpoVT family DNA-binding domain-containing protein, partial [Candidatus Woesearchaeota archaeon]|nr:AbrB/MazE/SpoVT family DNA-binding domain-containing protein [Candidatus Woesearchaeota archaeon]